MCVFCKIVKGEIPSYKIYEDNNFIAILDISQASKGHTLIIPKIHYEDIFSLNHNISLEIGPVIKKVSLALKNTFQVSGLNVLNNNGTIAGQSVFHFHVHLIPRYDDDKIEFHFENNVDKTQQNEFLKMQEEIKKNIF